MSPPHWRGGGMAHALTNAPLLAWIDEARSRYTMAICSNLSTLRHNIDLKAGIYKHFDRVFLSTETGRRMRK